MTKPEDMTYTNWGKVQVAGCKCDFCKGRFRTFNKITGDKAYWDFVYSPSKNGNMQGMHLEPDDFQCQYKKPAKPPVLQPPEEAVIGAVIAQRAIITGFNCCRCNSKNDYAAANQKDGTYLCFNCR